MEFTTQNTELPMNEPNTDKVFKNVKEFQVGAGSTQLNANKEGFFIGSDKFATAPFKVKYDGTITIGNPNGATTSITPLDGALLLSYDGTKYGSIAVDDFTNFIMSSTNNFQFFDSANHQLIVMDYANGLQINGDGGPKLKGESFELQLDKQMRFSGRVYPVTHATSGLDCGDSSKKWNYIYAKNNGIGDLVIFDKYCPYCEQKFQIEDNVIFHIYKDNPTEHDGLHSVPVHIECALNKPNKTKEDKDAFIEEKAQEQLAYELEQEKIFDAKNKLK